MLLMLFKRYMLLLVWWRSSPVHRCSCRKVTNSSEDCSRCSTKRSLNASLFHKKDVYRKVVRVWTHPGSLTLHKQNRRHGRQPLVRGHVNHAVNCVILPYVRLWLVESPVRCGGLAYDWLLADIAEHGKRFRNPLLSMFQTKTVRARATE